MSCPSQAPYIRPHKPSCRCCTAQAYKNYTAAKASGSYSPGYSPSSSYSPLPTPTASSSGRRRALLGSEGEGKAKCRAGTPYEESYEECGYVPGYRPVISVAGLHEVGAGGWLELLVVHCWCGRHCSSMLVSS